jgi:hypothetical protein
MSAAAALHAKTPLADARGLFRLLGMLPLGHLL